VIEVDLTDSEKEAFAHSVEAVSKTCGEVDEMLANL
jgi:malate/lactate dehydrogenase